MSCKGNPFLMLIYSAFFSNSGMHNKKEEQNQEQFLSAKKVIFTRKANALLWNELDCQLLS